VKFASHSGLLYLFLYFTYPERLEDRTSITMGDDMKQVQSDHREYHPDSGQHSPPRDAGGLSDGDLEKKVDVSPRLRESDEDGVVTMKTWAVVVVLAASYGISFWPVPFFSTIQGGMATSFGSEAAQGTWYGHVAGPQTSHSRLMKSFV